MTSAELRSALQTAPFHPFRLHFGSGRSVDVVHRDFVTLSPSGRTAIVFTRPGSTPEEGDEYQIVDILLIEAIEFLKNGKGRSAGGRRRR